MRPGVDPNIARGYWTQIGIGNNITMQRALLLLTTAFLLFSIYGVPRHGFAQTVKAGTAVLSGTVADPTGARIPGASLQLGGASRKMLTTDAVGHFSARLPAGRYTVTVTATGFLPLHRAAVDLLLGAQTDLPLTLEVNADIAEINVTAADVDRTSEAGNQAALTISGRKLDTLSDDDATFQQQINAMAGGGDSGSTTLVVDGFAGSGFPPKTAIREIRINSNPFSAEYDSIGFGRIEIFTKPGAQTLHGGIDVSGTDQSFNARNPYNVGLQPPYRDLNFDGNVNGPLGKAASFFIAGNHNDQQNNTVVNAIILGANLLNSPLSEAVPDPQSSSAVSARLDRQMTATNVLTGRYEWNNSGQSNSGVGLLVLPSEGLTTETTAQTLQLSDTQTLGAATVVETRFEYIRTRVHQTPNSTAPTLIVQGSFSGGGNGSQIGTDNQDHYEWQEYISHSVGKHFLRLGGRFRADREANTSTGGYNGSYTFASLASYQATLAGLAQNLSPAAIRANGGGASQFNLTTGVPSAEVSTVDASVYAEDEWKLHKDLTFNYGFRAETQTAIPDHFDPAPRLGLAYAWTPGHHKEPIAVLRTGFGMFYNRFGAGNLLTAVRQNGISQLAYFVENPDTYPNVPSPAALPSTEPTIYRVSPTLHAAYVIDGSFSIEHGFGNDKGILSATYIAARNDHQYLTRNLNAPLPGTYDPNVTGSGVRPLGGTQNIYQFSSDGVRHNQILLANADLNPTKRLSVWAFYNMQIRTADSSGVNSFPSNEYDLAQDYGRTAVTRQRLFSGLWYNSPKSADVGMFLVAHSGTPFNITTGTDLNGDTIFNDRPAFATDLSRAFVVKTRYGNFDAAPIPGQTIVPINFATSPAFVSLRLVVSKTFGFGPRPVRLAAPAKAEKPEPPEPRYHLRFSVESQNVTNHNNPGVPVGVLSSPFFGQSISLASDFSSISAANRTVTLHSNFSF